MSGKYLADRWSNPGSGCVGYVSLPGMTLAPPTAAPARRRTPVGGWGRASDSRTYPDQQMVHLFHSPQDLLPRLVLIHLEELK